MSKGYKKRENDSFIHHQRGERKTRKNESKQSKPFTGFTSPYRRLNEQALMQKNQQSDGTNNREKRFTGHKNDQLWDSRKNLFGGQMTPTAAATGGYSSRMDSSSISNKNFEQRFPPSSSSPYTTSAAGTIIPSRTSSSDLRHYGNHCRASEYKKDKYYNQNNNYNYNNNNNSHTNINPWSDTYARQAENYINENKAMKRINEEAVYGKVSWEYDVPPDETGIGGNPYKNYERPMDPNEFKEQCRRAYVRAAEERQRNAEMSVWAKCDWATYDKYKNCRR